MKLTLEPRKTTWVPFVDSVAQLKVQWRARAEYAPHNVRSANTWTTRTRYVFTGLQSSHPIPSSQLVLMEDGIPLAVTETVVSAIKDRFQSEEMDDPFVVLTDRLAGFKKSELQERRAAKNLLERTWVETIERSLRIENKTGKTVTLTLTVVDHPADELSFVQSEPAPSRSVAPEYEFDLELPPDEERTVKLTLRHLKREAVRLEPEKTSANRLEAPVQAYRSNVGPQVQRAVQAQREELNEDEEQSQSDE